MVYNTTMLSVGSIFSKERKRRGLSLKDVEKQIRVREKFLQAIEENDWAAFSSKIYITGIIKNYSRFLDLDVDKMIAYFRRDYERREEVHFKKRVESKYFKSETKRFVIAALSIIFIVFASYFGYQLTQYFALPTLVITDPQQSSFTSTERITVKGKTAPDATIVIFGERVYQNSEGVFEYDLPLKKGNNRLTIEVTGANGRKTEVSRDFILE